MSTSGHETGHAAGPTDRIDRTSWIDLIGARRAVDGSWRLGETEPGPHGSVQRPLHLRSFGTDVTAVLLTPDATSPSAVVVVPFYDTDTLLGRPSPLYPAGRPGPGRDYALRLAARGLGVLAVPWWAELLAEREGPTELSARYGPPAAAHAAQHPGVTGLGRSVADLLLAIDALTETPGVDADRIGTFGHSLGGKHALFLAALDPRIRAAVVHEPGVGFAHSNWQDPWYLGDQVPRHRDLDELTGLISPRPILYAGGGASDGSHNADIAQRAQQHWPDSGFDVLMHNTGHPLPDHVFAACASWLTDHLN
ncbi:dienelactone hydrolase family protein [Ruania rhizosphaerae]|uniref:dienelactone hydrolase family protein n=1 Tax=Ruania rhizosphaerae TaxID=1840413 RepID=UPI001F409E86|nr:acyl-CoA thioester hydrolase/BAAT C-terminal domain-containing protein [Ruania rhizosphaerae]